MEEWRSERPATKTFREWIHPHTAVMRVWHGFWDIADDRQVIVGGMGGVMYLRLPYAVKAKWLDDHAVSGGDRERFLRHWRAMDALYVRHLNSSGKTSGDEDV